MTTTTTPTDNNKLDDDDSNNNQESLPKDAEGLALQYDVILCGTGLVQSILASALARAGQRVLHVDGNDYYGELDAVWTLPYIESDKFKFSIQQQQQQQQQQQRAEEATSTTERQQQQQDASMIPLSAKGALTSLKVHSLGRHSIYYPLQIGTQVSTPFGAGIVAVQEEEEESTNTGGSSSSKSLKISLTDWIAAGAHQISPTLYVGLPDNIDLSEGFTSSEIDNKRLQAYLMQQHDIVPLKTRQAQNLLNNHHQSRFFALDVTPALLYASGPAVQGLLQSHVSDYLEFKALEGLLFYYNNNNNNSNSKLQKVPCSKNDVFASTMLSPMDKRRLMKFLQLALDYATLIMEEEQQQQQQQETTVDAAATTFTTTETNSKDETIQSLNERYLNQGRSLARPQNKAVAKNEMETLQACIADDMDFETYLQEKQKLSPQLTTLVRYALALETQQQSTSLETGMLSLCQHMSALGRFGTTAFLVPLYGSGELPQAFCRSAAVYGATYLLRRAAVGVCTKDDKIEGIALSASSSSADDDDDDDDNDNNKTSDDYLPPSTMKRIKCSHVIVPEEAMLQQKAPTTTTTKSSSSSRVLRRISILRGKPIRSEQQLGQQQQQQQQQRHVAIFPPNSVVGGNNANTNANAIHCLLLDEAVNVAPHGGCTVVHLTTTVSIAAQAQDETIADDSVLETALATLLASLEGEEAEEIFHLSFSFSLLDAEKEQLNNNNKPVNVDGLHIVRRHGPPGLTADPAFVQAAEIFANICPGVDFLKVAEQVDNAIKERFGDTRQTVEDDDEQMVLESAMGMIDSTKETSARDAAES